MEFSVTSEKDAQYLIDRGADPSEVYRWRVACEIGMYPLLSQAVQAGLDLIPNND